MTIKSSTRNLRDVRRFVERHARDYGFEEDVVEQLKLAVDEACSNVVEHAYAGKNDKSLEISIKAQKAAFTVIVRDTGKPFDLKSYKVPDLARAVSKRKSGGFGVHLMRSLMDTVTFRSTSKYNEVRLTKKLV